MLSSIRSKVKLGLPSERRPMTAVEIAPEGVLAASVTAPDQAPVYAFEPLEAGAVVPGLSDANLRAPEAVAEAIRSALAKVAPPTHDVTLVLPDTAVRIFVLNFDSLPKRDADTFAVLRFRLRKMIPFDVERAGLRYQVLKQNQDGCKVLVAVLPGAILAEYERAVRAAGYEPGAVLPSSLAALEAVDSMEAALTANLSPLALTTSITNGQDLLLYRTLDLPTDPGLRLEEVKRGIAVAAAYFEDKLTCKPQRLHYAGIGGASRFAKWINEPQLNVVDLTRLPESDRATALHTTDNDPSSATHPPVDITIAGVAGALTTLGKQLHVTLNLATRPFVDFVPAIKQLRVAMVALAVVAIGMGVVQHGIHKKAGADRVRDHSLDSQIARVIQERQGYQDLMRQPANAQVLGHAQALNRLFDEKAFSWTLAMEDLETLLPGGLQVTNIEPVRDKDGHITLRMRITGRRDRALELVTNLERSHRFLLPRIVGETAETSNGPNAKLEPVSASNLVDFELLADYSPATPEERSVDTKPAAGVADSANQLESGSHATEPVAVPVVHHATKKRSAAIASVSPAHRSVAHLESAQTMFNMSGPKHRPMPGGPQ